MLLNMHENRCGPDANRNSAVAVFFAAYVGPSMNPTLRDPEVMEIMPYDSRALRAGDVAFFLAPEAGRPIVHRIIRVTPAGIFTRGDNNTREDARLLQPTDIKGQVVAVWRGQKRREIAGGVPGQLTSRWLRWRRVLDRGVSHLLHPIYYALSRREWIARLLPASFRPRVVVFETQANNQFRLFLGQHIIGRFDDQRRQWEIQRPFRVFVDERELQRLQDERRTGVVRSIEDCEP
jgi:hypothetical protein